MSRITRDLLNAPFPQMVQNLGKSIAEAQYALDQVSIKIAQSMSGLAPNENGEMVSDPSKFIQLKQGGEAYSLLALGFTPTFYQFVDTLIEIKMSFSMSQTREIGASVSAKAGFGFWGASVTASYSQKYQYSAEGSSLMRTKLVTVPTPNILEQRLKDLVQDDIVSP